MNRENFADELVTHRPIGSYGIGRLTVVPVSKSEGRSQKTNQGQSNRENLQASRRLGYLTRSDAGVETHHTVHQGGETP